MAARSSSDRLRGIKSGFVGRLFRKIGDYRLPRSVGPTAVSQPFEMLNIVTDRRIAKNRWTSGAPYVDCEEFLEAASRNVNKTRDRMGSKQARAQEGSDAVIRVLDGNVVAEPSGDEFLPTVSNDALLADAACTALDPTWTQIGNPFTPKREAEDATRMLRTRRCPRPGTPRKVKGGIFLSRSAIPLDSRKRSSLSL